MITLTLILLPALAGALAFFLSADGPRRVLLVTTAALHFGLSVAALLGAAPGIFGGWLALDAVGALFLVLASGLFLAAAVYGIGYLKREGTEHRDLEGGRLFSNSPEARFTGCLLVFLAAMTFVCEARHLALLWVAAEGTTLASAPLIYFHRHHRSLEATWKYLLICSVGIALALLGTMFIGVASPSGSLFLDDLLAQPPVAANLPYLKAGFIFLLVGYGAKVGLAPLHSWQPDALAEAPSLVAALLSGALHNCAFLGILRGLQVLGAAGEAPFGQDLLVLLGLISMGVAAAFLIGQADFKRLLAYSSIEHMGILSVGLGLGGVGTFGAMLHAVNHSLAKGALFLVAGNIMSTYKTKQAADVVGASRTLPISGALWVAGLLALTGSPPFGLFHSELAVLRAAVDAGRLGVAALYLAFLGLSFVGLATVGLKMAQGPSPLPRHAEPKGSVVGPLVLLAGVLVLGLYVPEPLTRTLNLAAAVLGGP